MKKVKVGFICVHNSCRSQLAELIAKILASDVIEAYSGGTETKSIINQKAVDIAKKVYGIDMNETQQPKLIEELPNLDIVITMGCNVNCPFLPSKHLEDWGLSDPTGKSDEEFLKILKLIEEKVLYLKTRIENKVIML